jgi:hypothetical protein
MKNENQQVIVRNYNEELYNLKELENIKKQLLSFPELVKVLNKSRGSIYNLIANGSLLPIRFMNKFYFPKEQVYNLISPIEEQQQNKDYQLSKGMKNYLGLDLEEDALLPVKTPAPIKDKRTGKTILQDDKSKTQNKANTNTQKIRISN